MKTAAAQGASKAALDDISSAGSPSYSRQHSPCSGRATDGAQTQLQARAQSGPPLEQLGASPHVTSQRPCGKAAAAVLGQSTSMGMPHLEAGSTEVRASRPTFRLTSTRSHLISRLRPILEACGAELEALHGANTINIIRRCKALDAPGSLMGPEMTTSMLANLAAHFEICGLQLPSLLHSENEQELISFFEVSALVGRLASFFGMGIEHH